MIAQSQRTPQPPREMQGCRQHGEHPKNGQKIGLSQRPCYLHSRMERQGVGACLMAYVYLLLRRMCGVCWFFEWKVFVWEEESSAYGGGISWHFNFAWEISRFKLTPKFPMRNSGFSANFSHTTSTRCGLWRGVPHKSRGVREISYSEIYHREFDLARNPPPPCS